MLLDATRAMLSYRFGSIPRPWILLFEPSQRCNARCDYCYHWREAPQGELDAPTITRVLSEAWDLGCRLLYLSGGEPTIGPHFDHCLDQARSLGYRIQLTTNGSTLERKAADLAGRLDAVTVSLDAVGDEHDRLRGRKGLFQDAVSGIISLRQKFSPIRINMTVGRDNLDQVRSLAELAVRLDVQLHVRLMTNESRTMNLPVLDEAERRSLAELLSELSKRHPRNMATPRSYIRGLIDSRPFRCRLLTVMLNVDAAGRVYLPCPQYEGTKDHILGTVHRDSLRSLWTSPSARSIRQWSAGCTPNENCRTSCLQDTSLLANWDPDFLADQLRPGTLLRFFTGGRK